MREFTNILSDELVRGVSRSGRELLNDPHMTSALNVRSTEFGLRHYERPVDPFSGTVPITYPFPQLFFGKGVTLLADDDAVYVVDRTVTPWDITQITLTDIGGGAGSVTAGGQWHFLDMDKVWFLFNGSCVIFVDGADTLNYTEPNTVYVDSSVTIATGTHTHGRALVGGFSAGLWSTKWQSLFSAWEDQMETTLPFDEALDDNSVFWSSIGGGDFPLWFFFPERAIIGNMPANMNVENLNIDIADTQFYQAMLRNEFGFLKMPWDGTILKVDTFADNFIVYGDHGIAQLRRNLSADAQIATMAISKVVNFGIASRGAAGGDNNQQVFIAQNGTVYRVTSESMTRLGYEHIFAPLVGEDIQISYDADQNQFYISTDSRSFILTAQGLTEIEDQVVSGMFFEGAFIGTVDEATGVDVGQAEIVSSRYDFGIRGIKTITSFNLGIFGDTPVRVAVEYRYRKEDVFQRSREVLTNNEGNAVIRVSGTEFRFVVIGEDFNEFNLDYIQVKWQASDKRQIRGTYVSPSVAGAGE